MIMKKIFLAAIVALFAISANAQFWAGGAIGFESSKNKDLDTKASAFNFAPEFGYNFADNMGVGIALSMDNSKVVVGDNKTKENLYLVAPYFRYVFMSFGNISLFADAGAEFNLKDDNNNFFLGVQPGIAFQCNEKITLATRLGKIGYSNIGDGIFTAKAGAYIGQIGIYYNF